MVAVAVRAVSADISLYLEKIGNTLIIVRNELYLSACSTFKLIRGKFGRVFGGLLAELLYKVELFFVNAIVITSFHTSDTALPVRFIEAPYS